MPQTPLYSRKNVIVRLIKDEGVLVIAEAICIIMQVSSGGGRDHG